LKIKQIWIFFGIGLVLVVIAASMTWETSKGSHLELDGRILHVRTIAASPKATIVVVDFRAVNPSDISWQVKDIQMKLEGVPGEPTSQVISRYDMNTIFEYMKLIGPKFNDVLGIGDYIRPHTTVDRMVGARFEVPESQVEDRTAVRIIMEEMGRTVTEMVEKR